MKTNVLRCKCSQREPNGGDSVYYGMPHLRVTSDGNYFECYCPNCGRGGSTQYKSAYLALKAWNEMQRWKPIKFY